MLHFRSSVGSPMRPGYIQAASAKAKPAPPQQASTNHDQTDPRPVAPLQRQHFAGHLMPLVRPSRVRFSGEILKQQNIPVVDMRDFNSTDPLKKSQFVQKLGKSLADYGFVAIAGHGVPQEL